MKRFAPWIAVCAWAALIFFLSAQPDLRTGAPGDWDYVLRKLAHITVFGILCILIQRATQLEGVAERRSWYAAFALTILYAISDEFHQSFVAGRSAAATDVLYDTLGAAIAYAVRQRSLTKRT